MRQDLDQARRLLGVPRVNLLPAEIGERRSVKRQRTVLAAVGAGVLVLLAAGYLGEAGRASRAHADAARQRAAVEALTAGKAKLRPWADLNDQVIALEQLRASVYQREVRFSGVLQDLSMLMPDEAYLTSLNVNVVAPAATTGSASSASSVAKGGVGPAGAPGTGSPIATISVSGVAEAHVDVGKLVRLLDGTIKKGGQPVYINPYFTSSEEQGTAGQPSTVTFQATVDLSPAAASGRYQKPDDLGGN